MRSNTLALVNLLADIPDFRQSQGKRYSLTAILSSAVAATLCGYKSYSAIAEWGHFYRQSVLLALGFTSNNTPCAYTLHNIFSSQKATQARSLDCHHGRIEERSIVVGSMLSKQDEVWPRLEQIFELKRHRVEKRKAKRV